MKEKTREKIINTFRIIILSLIFSAAIGYSLADWVPPSRTPPLGNTPPPINVGGATQVKSGTLMIDQWLVAGKARVRESTVAGDSGKVLVTKDYVDGKVGGGTGSWVNVPFDTAPFDTKCSYRFSFSGGLLQTSGAVVSAVVVWSDRITDGQHTQVRSSNKTQALFLGTYVGPVTLLQKQC